MGKNCLIQGGHVRWTDWKRQIDRWIDGWGGQLHKRFSVQYLDLCGKRISQDTVKLWAVRATAGYLKAAVFFFFSHITLRKGAQLLKNLIHFFSKERWFEWIPKRSGTLHA